MIESTIVKSSFLFTYYVLLPTNQYVYPFYFPRINDTTAELVPAGDKKNKQISSHVPKKRML